MSEDGMGRQIKVVGTDLMCFWVDAITLEPQSVSHYDAYAIVDPEPGIETIDSAEWMLRRIRRQAEQEEV